MLFKIFIHILYIQIILYKGYLAKQTVELNGYVNISKSLNKSTINTEKSYGSCFPSMTRNPPQDLRLFSTMRNEVTACRFSEFSYLFR